MILVIDNYDSFTYNLVHLLYSLDQEVTVCRNDKVDLGGIRDIRPDAIVISPGPATPKTAGISIDCIRTFENEIPILGVCLGHQAIGMAYGGKVVRAPEPIHGKIDRIRHNEKGIFRGLPSPFHATRYHSLIVERDSLPGCLEVTAETENGLIMGLKHEKAAVEGVQFHPESIATKHGRQLVANFLERYRVKAAA